MSCQSPNCCPNGISNASCIQYTGPDLSLINVQSGEYLDEIIQKLNTYVFSETQFTANESDSIKATAGGTNGHSPQYDLKVDPSLNNAISVSPAGVMVDINTVGDGKVKVDSSDTKDYLVNQLVAGIDPTGIVTITPTALNGKMYLVPSLDVAKLINYIKDNLFDTMCAISSGCIPVGFPTTTTTQSTTSTSSTSSSSSTSTTTQAPNDFIINNLSGLSTPFTIYLADEVSLINYVVDSTLVNNQIADYKYTGTANLSKVIVQHSTQVATRIQIVVNGVIFATIDNYIGNTVIPNIPAKSNITVNVIPGTVTTSTTTSTSSTSTSTTTTTTQTTSSSTTATTTCNCGAGFTPAPDASHCIKVEELPATPPSGSQNAASKTNVAYSTNGSWIFQSGYNVNGSGTASQISLTNPFWKNGAGNGSDGNLIDGPLNRTGVWTSAPSDNQDVGFTVCVNLSTSKTYYIGMGCDNYGTVKVDGVIIIQQDEVAIQAQYGLGGATFKSWGIYPIVLSAGPHNIELIGHNVSLTAAMGFEVYDATPTQISNAQSYTDLGAHLIFSTKDYIGSPITIGSGGVGYTCPTGYTLSSCSNPPKCQKITIASC